MAVTHGHGNPNWTQDEVILALDLYFRCGGSVPSKDDNRVVDVSNVLRSLPYHALESRKESFRNPAGVSFKLQNLRKEATGIGLGNTSKMDKMVWDEFGSNPNLVSKLAEAIREGITLTQAIKENENQDSEDEFFEGRLLTQLHKKRERNRKLRTSLINSRKKSGILTCDMCLCSTKSSDVKIEDAMFEAHHIIPVSSTKERRTLIKDLALLCANCHRLLHRAISVEKKWLSIDDGKNLLY
jgi:5-methylcytosine-specific restriction protein A